jgi:hypothetical protein
MSKLPFLFFSFFLFSFSLFSLFFSPSSTYPFGLIHPRREVPIPAPTAGGASAWRLPRRRRSAPPRPPPPTPPPLPASAPAPLLRLACTSASASAGASTRVHLDGGDLPRLCQRHRPADACSPPPPRLHLGRCLLPRSAPPPRVRRCLLRLCPFAASSLLPPAVAAPAATGTTRGQRWEKGGGARWSHEIVAPPPLRKPRGAPGAAPPLEPLQNQPFERAPPGAAAGAGALPNRAKLIHTVPVPP